MDRTEAIAAILAALKALMDVIIAFFTGRILQQNKQIEHELRSIESAVREAGRVDLLSDDDVVHELGQRGLSRLRDE